MTKPLRVTGRVKFFADDRGYGFLQPDDGGAEVFVHRTDVASSLRSLLPDQRVSFEIADSKKGNGKKAVNVEPLPERTSMNPSTPYRAGQ